MQLSYTTKFDETWLYDTWFKVVTFAEEKVPIEQPADLSMDSKAEAITEAFETAKKSVVVNADSGEDFIMFYNAEPFMTFTLPKTLCKFLSINPDTIYYTGITTINIQHLKQQTRKHHMLCLSNIVESQPYGGQMLPILRIIPLNSSIKGTVCEQFHPLFYMPVTEKVLTNINIRFKSVNSDEVFIEDKSTVTVTLHFRKSK